MTESQADPKGASAGVLGVAAALAAHFQDRTRPDPQVLQISHGQFRMAPGLSRWLRDAGFRESTSNSPHYRTFER